MGKGRKPPPSAAPSAPFNAALAGLSARVDDVPRRPAPPARPPERSAPARAVVRMERAGRGGKTVTVVEKLDLRARDLEAWLADLKRALGCGGAIEGEALVLQGDTRERVGKLLESRGVRNVTVASGREQGPADR